MQRAILHPLHADMNFKAHTSFLTYSEKGTKALVQLTSHVKNKNLKHTFITPSYANF